MDGKLHATGSILDSCLWVGSHVVEELADFCCCVFCSLCLFGGNVAQCRENGVVYGNGVVEEGATHLLDIVNVIC